LKNDAQHIDRLIAKYLAGEISREEEDQLTTWIKSAPDHEKYFGDLLFVHNKAISSHKVSRVNPEKAWDLLQLKMDEMENVSATKVKKRTLKTWAGIAASILVLVGSVSIFFFLTDRNNPVQTATVMSADSIVNQMIDEDMQVVLNRHSQVKLVYTRQNKEVQLTGEAYFKVENSENKPLLVEADGVYIEDIGTAFNVKALPGSNWVEVYVESGKVKFFTPSNEGILLQAGETGRYEKASDSFSVWKTQNLNTVAYTTKIFVFTGDRLADVVSVLSDVYSEQIALSNPQLADCTISVSFHNETLPNIMDIIAETLDLQLVITDAGYVLQGDNCYNR
jgi:ferric-dicitrate binding protein FerR (iron transport regulator)